MDVWTDLGMDRRYYLKLFEESDCYKVLINVNID